MKKYSKETMKGMTGIDFAKDVLQHELDIRENPNSSVADKLRATICELEVLEEAKLTYPQLRSIFSAWEAGQPDKHLIGYIVFSQDSWPDQIYPLAARTYIVSSDNKAYQPKMGGYSVYGSSLDGKDLMVRLDAYMASEKGGKDGWKVDYCLLIGRKV